MQNARSIVRLALLGALISAAWLAGCAQEQGRRQLERVAKDWCESIRASQVIPVYPLTEDIRPGDIFMVQTTIEDQSRIYKQRGFFSLDDLRHRMPVKSYKSMYFDGFWLDDFAGPNPRPSRAPGSLLIEANAPRAAFPTYAFEARSGLGAALALPIQGVPVGLNFMNADRAEGTITISDARTYAGEAQELYEGLVDWAETDKVRTMLAGVYDQVKHTVYLRVVTRVYFTGSVSVSLRNTSTTGVGLKAGAAPEVDIPDTAGTMDEAHDRLLAKLNERANASLIRDAAGNVIPGGAVKFTMASRRQVALEESFDTLLAIGYLGFDVPVFEGGVVGAPIPTFERLEHGLTEAAPQRVDKLSPQQASFQIQMDAFDAMVKQNPELALNVVGHTVKKLGTKSFPETKAALKSARATEAPTDDDKKLVFVKFKEEARGYVAPSGGAGQRYGRFADAFALAYDARHKPE